MVVNQSPSKKFHLIIFYSQFSLEPDQPDYGVSHFEDERDSVQEFSSFPYQVAIGTPGNTGECDVEIEFCMEMPELEDSVQAVSFPLTIGESGRLFLRTVFGGEEEEENHFAILPGQYDVLTRFFPMQAEKEHEEVGLRAWRVALSFLPYGTVGANTFRREYGEIPTDIVLHDTE
jgi:hypothetical protein